MVTLAFDVSIHVFIVITIWHLSSFLVTGDVLIQIHLDKLACILI